MVRNLRPVHTLLCEIPQNVSYKNPRGFGELPLSCQDTADSWDPRSRLRHPRRGFCGSAQFFKTPTGGREGFLGGGPEDRASGIRGRTHGRELTWDAGLGCRGRYLMLSGNSQSCPKPDELSWSPKSGRSIFSWSHPQQTVGKNGWGLSHLNVCPDLISLSRPTVSFIFHLHLLKRRERINKTFGYVLWEHRAVGFGVWSVTGWNLCSLGDLPHCSEHWFLLRERRS